MRQLHRQVRMTLLEALAGLSQLTDIVVQDTQCSSNGLLARDSIGRSSSGQIYGYMFVNGVRIASYNYTNQRYNNVGFLPPSYLLEAPTWFSFGGGQSRH